MNYTKELTIKEAMKLNLTKKYVFTECDPTYRGSAIYLLEFVDGVKVGIARNLVNRLKNYQSPWVKPVINAKYYKLLTPQTLELQIKRRFKGFTKEGSSEYFHNSTIAVIQEYLEQLDYYKR